MLIINLCPKHQDSAYIKSFMKLKNLNIFFEKNGITSPYPWYLKMQFFVETSFIYSNDRYIIAVMTQLLARSE